jgi:hypothetical protein
MVASFHPKALPPMLRRNYGLEFAAWWFLPVMLGAVEGGAMGNIVKKAFDQAPGVPDHELNFAVASVVAAPAVANITSFAWAALAHGKAKVRFIVGLQLATVALIALLAFAQPTRVGLWYLVALVIASRICWTGVITLRTAIWGANYPRADRARVAGNLATVQSAVMAVVGVSIGLAMDWDEESFHWIFPLTALVGFSGVAIYRNVRLRGQKRLARHEMMGDAAQRLSLNPASILRVLRQDSLYRRFMTCMFVFGLGNLMLTAPLAIVLQDVFRVDYTTGILITTAIPAVLMPPSIPLWGRLMRRCHVIEFRSIHAWSYVSAAVVMWMGVMLQSIELLFVSSVLTGIANGGGVLAWNLGHHDFAPTHRDSEYMGVHVTLTGIRGVMAPILGVGLYEWFSALSNDAQSGGGWVFGVTVVLNTIGAIGFVMMRRARTRERIRATADAARSS